jgi:acyl-CoA thioester hydrolase
MSHQIRVRVRYAETDQMGVVYYANYLIWMELGRAEYCRAAGVRYRDLERDEGVLLAVVDAHCRYISPARYDEEVLIMTSISNSNRRMVEFAYDMRNESGGPIARGTTKHMFLGPDMKPARLPEKYHGLFGIE